MTGQYGGFRQAATRFSAEVERALTRARRAARDAKAESSDFRQRTEELVRQAKNAKPRRGAVTPTNPDARADAVAFRNASGLPVPDLPAVDEAPARRPNRPPADDDFTNLTVLFDVDSEPLEQDRGTPDWIDSPEPEVNPPSDFSHQRILMDATEETYRPDEILQDVFDDGGPENRR